MSGPKIVVLPKPLTNHELKVIRLLSQGWTLRTIAAVMNTTEQVVKNQALYAREKLDAKTNAELVAIAIRRKLI